MIYGALGLALSQVVAQEIGMIAIAFNTWLWSDQPVLETTLGTVKAR